MDEEAWLNSTDPRVMLAFLGPEGDPRMLRLLACAFVRRLWPLLSDRSRQAVRIAEAFADGLASAQTLTVANLWAAEAMYQARQAAHLRAAEVDEDPEATAAAAALVATAQGVEGWTAQAADSAVRAAYLSAGWAADAAGRSRSEAAGAAEAACNAEREAQSRLVRCIFDNPFRPAPALDPAVLQWNGGVVPNLAAAIYHGRAFDRLPCLAHGLREADCTDLAILGHCQVAGPHASGCFVVDLILRPRPPTPTEELTPA